MLCDRFFDSTIAYQAFGRGSTATSSSGRTCSPRAALVPDRTLLSWYAAAPVGLGRVANRRSADRLELAAPIFTSASAKASPRSPSRSPSACASSTRAGARSLTSALIFQALTDLFPWMADASECSEEFFASLDRPAPGREVAMPDAFENILGQPRVRDFLRTSVKGGRVTHAYLFVGPSGSNKTMAAYALAQAVICPKGPTVRAAGSAAPATRAGASCASIPTCTTTRPRA